MFFLRAQVFLIWNLEVSKHKELYVPRGKFVILDYNQNFAYKQFEQFEDESDDRQWAVY